MYRGAVNVATAMVNEFRRFIADVPRHMSEIDVIHAIIEHAGVVPQRVQLSTSTDISNSCYGIAHFNTAADALWLWSIGMRWPDGTSSHVRP